MRVLSVRDMHQEAAHQSHHQHTHESKGLVLTLILNRNKSPGSLLVA